MRSPSRHTYAVTIYGRWAVTVDLPGAQNQSIEDCDNYDDEPQVCKLVKAWTRLGANQAAKRWYHHARPNSPITRTSTDVVRDWTDKDWIAHGFIPVNGTA